MEAIAGLFTPGREQIPCALCISPGDADRVGKTIEAIDRDDDIGWLAARVSWKGLPTLGELPDDAGPYRSGRCQSQARCADSASARV
jgi:hypothetical protein